jgi:membrane protein YdbS with pleckstrin-like domain
MPTVPSLNVVAPRFRAGVVIPRLLPLLAFGALILAMPLTALLTALLGHNGLPFDDVGDVPGWAVFLACAGSAALLGPFIAAAVARQVYAGTSYALGPDTVEHRRDWIFSARRSVPYRSVVEVTWSVGPLQRGAGLGTVELSTTAEREGRSGLRLWDIPEPEATYRELLRRVEAARKGG